MQLVLAALLLTLDIAASWVPTAPALRPRHDAHTRRAASTTRRAASISAAVAGGARLVYCEGLSKSYDGQRFQFRDISLGVATGQRANVRFALKTGTHFKVKHHRSLLDLEPPPY